MDPRRKRLQVGWRKGDDRAATRGVIVTIAQGDAINLDSREVSEAGLVGKAALCNHDDGLATPPCPRAVRPLDDGIGEVLGIRVVLSSLGRYDDDLLLGREARVGKRGREQHGAVFCLGRLLLDRRCHGSGLSLHVGRVMCAHTLGRDARVVIGPGVRRLAPVVARSWDVLLRARNLSLAAFAVRHEFVRPSFLAGRGHLLFTNGGSDLVSKGFGTLHGLGLRVE